MEDLNNVWGLPTIYKNVNIYPIRMKDCMSFYECSTCLIIEQNKSQDIKLLKMSYLYFLCYLSNVGVDEKGKSFNYLITYLYKLLKLVFQKDCDIKINEATDAITIHLLDNDSKETILSEQDFNKIKKIIIKNNLIRYSEDILDVELEQKIKEAEEFLSSKNSDNATLEESILSFAASMNKFPQEIMELTIYQFKKILERKNLLKTWEVYLYPAMKGGEQDKIKHWLSHIPEKGMYDHVIMSMDEFNKITSDAGVFSK
jgi:hypothetical protein